MKPEVQIFGGPWDGQVVNYPGEVKKGRRLTVHGRSMPLEKILGKWVLRWREAPAPDPEPKDAD